MNLLVHWFIYLLFIHSFIHSFIYSFIHLFIHYFIYLFMYLQNSAPHKIPYSYLISWCGYFVEIQSFSRVSGNSPENLPKLFFCTKFRHQEIRRNFGIRALTSHIQVSSGVYLLFATTVATHQRLFTKYGKYFNLILISFSKNFETHV